MMKYDTIIEALVIVDKLKRKTEEHPDKDLILYAAQALQMKVGDYNYMYPLLKQGLNKQFNLYVKDGWKEYINQLEGSSILDIGAGDGAYLNSLDVKYAKFSIDNKPSAIIPNCHQTHGSFPQDMPNWKYDIILMNEFLHLFELDKALNLIKIAKTFLKDGGCIVVTENMYTPHLQYRLKKLGGGRLHTSKELGLRDVMFLERHFVGKIPL